MSEHYYSAKPNSKHDLEEISFELRGVRLTLNTDAGVFSKKKLDTGTELLIKSLRLSPEFHQILDLGCGYGPIGLTLAKLIPEATVYLVDINERAVDLTTKNAALNQIFNVVIAAGNGFSSVVNMKFDLIVTNPPIRAGKQVIYPLMEQAYQQLNQNGWLVAVILTRQGAKSLEKKLHEVFGNVMEWEKGSGYRVLASRKS